MDASTAAILAFLLGIGLCLVALRIAQERGHRRWLANYRQQVQPMLQLLQSTLRLDEPRQNTITGELAFEMEAPTILGNKILVSLTEGAIHVTFFGNRRYVDVINDALIDAGIPLRVYLNLQLFRKEAHTNYSLREGVA